MLDVFKQMAQTTLQYLGEDAWFDGASEPVKVNIEYAVEMAGIDGERRQDSGDLIVHRDIATVESRHDPKARQCFTLAGKRWRLDSLVQDTGVVRRFVVMPV